MSAHFKKSLTVKQMNMVRGFFSKIVAIDEYQVLYDDEIIDGRKMIQLATKLGQPVTIERHSEEDVKTMGNGIKYKFTCDGWKKIPLH